MGRWKNALQAWRNTKKPVDTTPISKAPSQIMGGIALTGFSQTLEAGYAFPVVSNLGRNKAVLSEWWLNPIHGQPRLMDIRTVRSLARNGVGSMCTEKILDIIAQQEWTIRPRKIEGGKDKFNRSHADKIKEFLYNPNRNNETLDSVIRKIGRNILETDDGVGVKVFSEYKEGMNPNTNMGINVVPNPQYTPETDLRDMVTIDRTPTRNAELIEFSAEDGTSFLKQTDMHGYLLNYWQYSYIVPKRPIGFIPREICYISINPRAGSPYGYSPFESIIDWLTYIIQAGKYNRRFYENSSFFPMHITFEDVKDKQDMQYWQDYLQHNFMGPEKAWGAFLTNGHVKVSPITFNNRDLQNLETQQWYFKLVCAKLKVPPSMLGFTENVNRATAGQQTATFRSEAIRPLTKAIERAFNREVIPDLDPDACCEFAFIQYSDLDEEQRRANNEAVYIQNSVKTPNEVREGMDMEEVEGGDVIMWEMQKAQAERQMSFETQMQNQQAKGTKKADPSASPSYQGDSSATKKEYKPKYIGICTYDDQEVYDSTLFDHSKHTVMRYCKFVDLSKVLGGDLPETFDDKLEKQMDRFTGIMDEAEKTSKRKKDVVDKFKKKYIEGGS